MILVPKFVLSNENNMPTRKEFKLRGAQSKKSAPAFFNKASLQAAQTHPNQMQNHLFASHYKQEGLKFESDDENRLIQLQVNCNDGAYQIVHMKQPTKNQWPSTVVYGGILVAEQLERLTGLV